jgi:hypothetical protein
MSLGAEFAQMITDVKKGVRTLFSLSGEDAPEKALARAVANEAGLPEDALVTPPTVYKKHFRLIQSVDEACASRLAQVAKEVGFNATLLKTQDTLSPKRRLHSVGPYLGIMTVLVIMILANEPDAAKLIPLLLGVFLLVKLTRQKDLKTQSHLHELPLAFGHDLRPYLAEGYRHLRLPPHDSGVTAPDLHSPANTREPSASGAAIKMTRENRQFKSKAAPPTDHLQALISRTHRHLDALYRTIEARSKVLPDVMINDLKTTLEALRAQTSELGEKAGQLQLALKDLDDTEATASAARIESRLIRLRTLKGAGESVDEEELRTLEKGLQAYQDTLEEVDALEASSTRVMARLLEIGSVAASASRELNRDNTPETTGPLLLDQLRTEVKAGAAAAAEVRTSFARN